MKYARENVDFYDNKLTVESFKFMGVNFYELPVFFPDLWGCNFIDLFL